MPNIIGVDRIFLIPSLLSKSSFTVPINKNPITHNKTVSGIFIFRQIFCKKPLASTLWMLLQRSYTKNAGKLKAKVDLVHTYIPKTNTHKTTKNQPQDTKVWLETKSKY